MIEKVGIISNMDIDVDLSMAYEVADCILSNGSHVIMQDEYKKDSVNSDIEYLTFSEMLDNSDMLIAIGGDGTYIRAAREIYKKNIPILGINMGKLGFLTEIEKEDLKKEISKILNGNCIIQKRMMLKLNVFRDGQLIATNNSFNEIVVSKANISKVLRVNLYVDDSFVDSYPGDGMIISTPTGSTAYSLSAGGPIVQPDMNLFVITPICPHMLYSRSHIISEEKKIKLKIVHAKNIDSVVTVDGCESYYLNEGDWIEVEKSEYSVKTLVINDNNYFNSLRNKIHHREERISQHEIY